MRGDKERKCIDFVKSHLAFECCYGITQLDKKEIDSFLNDATPNKDSNAFPDFVFENGFIEHFQISSGKITKKGSKHLQEFNSYQNENKKELFSNMSKGDYSPMITSIKYSQHTYSNLSDSFKTSWESHISSLEKYTGNKDIGVFMVEYKDACIEMTENIFSNVKKGISCGNLIKPKQIDYYSLCHDKELLNYIYEYKNKIHYVIYVYNKGIEIINVRNIPELLMLIPYNYCIAGMCGTVRMDTYIPIPNIEV